MIELIEFTIREKQTDDDMMYFYHSCFETAKNTDAIQYTSLKEKYPEKEEKEIFQMFRQEIDESFDFDREDCRIFFLEDDEGRIGGYVWVALRDNEDAWDLERPLWIFDINVHPDFRRRGLGHCLLRETEVFAKEMKRNIGLFVHEKNLAAVRLYKSEGYVTKTIPLSMVLDDDYEYSVPSGFIVRKASIDDESVLWSLGLDSFSRLVRFSCDVSDDEISKRYHKYLQKYASEESNHKKYVVLTSDERVIAFLWIGVAYFSDKYGLVYDLAIDERYRTEEIENLLVAIFKKWSCEKGLPRAYLLYHTGDDISLEAYTRSGFTLSGFFLEKQVT